MTAAGLVLAAGEGRRLGKPKALVRFGGELLVERAVQTLVEAHCRPVVVVVGAAAHDVAEQANLGAAEIVSNRRWREGMGTSVTAGLARLQGRVDAVVITLVDQPLVTTAAVLRLLEVWDGDNRAVVATYDGQARHPVVLPASRWADAVATAQGDVGLRRWLRAHPDLVVRVPCDDIASPLDLDTPADLVDLRRAAATMGEGNPRGTTSR